MSADPIPRAELVPSRGIVTVGTEAPDFSWRVGDQEHRLHELSREAPVFVLFYPLAYAHVCREDVTQLDRHAGELGHPGVQLLAVSVDRIEQARRFLADREVHHLEPVADPDLAIAGAYGVVRRGGIAERASVLVARGGRVAAAAVHEIGFPRPIDELRSWREALQG